jgi:rod shape-determining protein MreB and related proteins
MLRNFYKSLESILYIQLKPDRVTIRRLRYGKESIEYSDAPWVAIVDHPKRGKQVIAVGSVARTIRPDLEPGEELIIGNGFEHPRSMIGDIDFAVIALKDFFRQVFKGGRLLMSPICVIQALGTWDGGLTGGEKYGLKAVAIAAGAKMVFIIESPDRFTDEQIWALLYDPKSS